MTVRELSEQAGLSRQWINKNVDLGNVPGVSRKENGRLEIEETEALQRWISSKRQAQQARQKRRLSVQERIDKLSKTEEKEYLRPSELAQIIGNSTGFIRENALKIPGVCLYQNGYRFKKTPALQKWVQKQCDLFDAEKCRYEFFTEATPWPACRICNG